MRHPATAAYLEPAGGAGTAARSAAVFVAVLVEPCLGGLLELHISRLKQQAAQHRQVCSSQVPWAQGRRRRRQREQRQQQWHWQRQQ